MSHRFNVGEFECIVVNDGCFPYPHPAGLLFANAPADARDRALREEGIEAEQWEELVSDYPCLVVYTDDHIVLIDTGAGNLAPTTGRLVPRLKQEGIEPEDVDLVILTHGHPDHVGGTVDDSGALNFPRARWVMSKEEWDFWDAGADLGSLNVPDHFKEVILASARRGLPPIKDRLKLVTREEEIVPGIGAIHAPGHTPGHMALSIRSAGDTLLFAADAFVHPIHVSHPGWWTAFDFDSEQVVRTREMLIERATEDRTRLFATHFPFPCIGEIQAGEEGHRWRQADLV